MAKKNVYASRGAALCRSARTAADAPASGTWTPDNLNAAEISGGVVADDVTVIARDFADIRIFASFTGTLAGTESVTVVPQMAVYDPSGVNGSVNNRRWIELPDAVLSPNGDNELVGTDGHYMAFRIRSLTLGTATNVSVWATGGSPLVLRD